METIWPAPISVVAELPPEKHRVLWFDGEWETGTISDIKMDGKRWWRPDNHWDICEITPDMFWMPLPAEPNPKE